MQLFIPIQATVMANRQTDSTIKPIKIIKAELLDPRLNTSVISIYEATGEVRDIKDNQPVNHEVKGITTGYKLLRKSMGPSTYTGISIAIPAKILASDYLKGITTSTISKVYEELINQGIIYIDYSDFLNAQIVMVDLKHDSIKDDLKQSLKEITSRIKPSVRYRKHSNDNITIGQRKEANNNNLYIKFYDKRKELESQSNVFNAFYKPDCPDNLLRTEITLHSKQLKEHFKDYNNTLQSLLQANDTQGMEVMNEILKVYLNHNAKFAANDNSKPDRDAITVMAILELLFQIPAFERHRLSDFQDKVIEILQPGRDKKLRIKALTKKYFNEHLDNEDSLHQFNKGDNQ